ncbi:hypothetical protein AVEN_60278-1 [Araneus ventricosus]|uniref:CCHC-type domain-containing protein n=1 Tax=Araneus ventricosus TaxID=182803 RepID=A0A4Y2CYX0_ARAVE|nr:hypothetical protein AVEN_60278-1 [Araneus ventricosus]
MNELGKTFTERELVRYIIEGLPDTFESIALPLSTNRAIPLVDLRQTLLNFEKKNAEKRNEEFKAYKTGDRHKAKSCYVCNKPGHLQKDCWFRKKQNGKNFQMKKYPVRSRANGRNYEQHRSEHAKISKESDKKEFALTLHEEDTDDALTEWHLDSACTYHMTPDETWLVNKKVENKIISVPEEGRNIESICRGEPETITMDDASKNVKLKNVLCVPKLRCNLLSVPSIVKSGNEVVLNEKGAFIYSEDGAQEN